jgi:DNA-binding PadR family transcriptional regulator
MFLRRQRLYVAVDITCDIACDVMFSRFAEIKEMLFKDIEKFRQNGAVSPEKAMSVEELGLSPRFKAFLRGSPRLFGVFVKVDGKYYLSEERLRRVEEQLSARPLRQWLRHTASVPKGLLRFYVFKLLKEKPMSGSEIMEEVERQTGGQWKPSPGSVYPLLTWLRENGYAEELPREITGIKRYVLTEKGMKFFEEHANFEDELQKKMGTVSPMFFLRMGLHADGLQELQEPVSRFFSALVGLWAALKENLTEQTLKETEDFLNGASEKIEELTRKIEGR